MKTILTRATSALTCGILAVFGLNAKTGAPHTVKAETNFTDVTLTWCAPSAEKELRWHDNGDYNGDTAPCYDIQKTVKTWVGTKFSSEDLTASVGEKISAIKFFQYRPCVSTQIFVIVDGKTVASADADMTKYAKNTWQTVELAQPVTIETGKTYLIAVCFEAGNNMDFVAIKDRAANASGKGDLMSVNGTDWVATGNGEYLITAILANDADENPASFNIYRGETKLGNVAVTDEKTTEFSFEATQQPEGKAQYTVAAVYNSGEVKSFPVSVDLVAYSSLLPGVTVTSATVDMLDVKLNWSKPLTGGTELTWSDKSDGISIGGTATSNTKVWVRNQFTASDLIAFRGGKISAINYKFAEAVITGVTLFIVKDGVIDYSEEMSEDIIKGIKEKEWTKFPLKTPYQLEDGHRYDYGLYVLHTPKMHPMSVDGGATIDVKGNSFSVSSPNTSKGFNASNPSWKTLKSGGMEGNWLMTADITGAPSPITIDKYFVLRDGKQIATTSELTFNDKVDDLGNYKYAIVSSAGNKESMPTEYNVNVKLPAAYAAPLIENASFDQETKKFELSWNMDKEIAHCGEAYALASFEEKMDNLMWGTQFTADELAPYNGYEITKIKFMIGEATGDFKVGVYTTKGVALSEIEIPASAITPTAVYTIKLPKPVVLDGTQPLMLAYTATVPANNGAVVIDAGPLVEGGAKVSLTNGVSWLNLSTLNPTYGKYNIFISAMASQTGSESKEAPASCVEIAHKQSLPVISASVDKVYGIDTQDTPEVYRVVADVTPKPDYFNIYCNGEKVAETKQFSYEESIKRFAPFEYYVTTVFTNGWESNPSATSSFTNRIAQKAIAPYGLKASQTGSDLKLEWEAPEKATVLTYVPADVEMKALKMTGGTTLTSYCASLFPEKELADHVGDVISHIQFGCGNNEITSCQVFVIVGENIVYSQTVPVSTLVKGVNDIRLNEPVKILPGVEMGVGFLMVYPSTAAHPLGCYDATDNSGYADLISASASSGYWYSLHTKYKSNYNWYIKAILAKDDQSLEPQRAASRAGITYNIYRDGVKLDNVSDNTFTVKNAQDGRYYVTAVDGDNESGESNSILFGNVSGIEDVISDTDDAVVYDRASALIIAAQNAKFEIFNLNGAIVASGEGTQFSVAYLANGVYTVRVTFPDKVAVIKISK